MTLPQHPAPRAPEGAEPATTRYAACAQDIASLILNGSLRPGDRLPSVREASKSRQLSPSTIFEAYYLLEAQGLIHARPRSGYYVSAKAPAASDRLLPSRPASRSVDVEVSALVFEILRLSQDRALLPLGSAFPDPALFPLDKLARSMATSLRRLAPQRIVDDLSPGSLRLRQQISRRYAVDGMQVAADDLVITNGALEALNLCLQAVTEPGDAVVVESPTFYAPLQALERLKLRALPVATDPETGLDLAALAQALQDHRVKACWLMPNFQNPLGSLMPPAGKQALAEMLAHHDVPLIEDDVYGELHFGTRKPPPVKAYDRAGLVLHCASFSKCLSPGYRVGWVAAGRYAARIAQLKLMSSLSAPVPSQVALSDYLAQGGYDLHLRRLRQALLQRRDTMLDAVAGHFPAGTRVSRPEGGYFLWVELPPQVNALQLLRAALDAGISLAPGQLFAPEPHFAHHVRLNYGAVEPSALRTAVARLGALAQAQLGTGAASN